MDWLGRECIDDYAGRAEMKTDKFTQFCMSYRWWLLVCGVVFFPFGGFIIVGLSVYGFYKKFEADPDRKTRSIAIGGKVAAKKKDESQEVVSMEFNSRNPVDISNQVPEDVLPNLLKGERAYYFTYIDVNPKAGCSGKQSAKSWVLISDKRVVYNATVKQNNSYVQNTGAIPLNKISFVSASSSATQQGCSSVSVCTLSISSGGGQIDIPIPTEEEAKRLQTVISSLQHKHDKDD